MLSLSALASAALIFPGALALPVLARGARAGQVAAGLGLLLCGLLLAKGLTLRGSPGELAPRLYLSALLLLPPMLLHTAHALRNVQMLRRHLGMFCWIGGALWLFFAWVGDGLLAGLQPGPGGALPLPGPLAVVALAWSAAVLAAGALDSLGALFGAADADVRRRAALALVLLLLGGLMVADWWWLSRGQAPWGHAAALPAWLLLAGLLWRWGGPLAMDRLLSQTTLDATREALLLFDGSGRLQVANQAAADVLQGRRRKLLGRQLDELLGVSTAHIAAIAALREPGFVERIVLPGADRGTPRMVEIQPLALRDGAGALMATLIRLRLCGGPAPAAARPRQLGPALFEQLLARELRLRAGGGGQPGALLAVAIEDLEQLAQRQGLAALAELQQAVEERLEMICDWPVDIAELRSGVHALLVTGLADAAEAERVAARAAELFAQPWHVAGASLTLPARVALLPELRAYHDVDDVLFDMESGLELARRRDERGAQVLSAQARNDAAFNLEAAISNDSLGILCQPLIDLGGQAVTGFRVALHWAPLGIEAMGTAAIQRLAQRCHVGELLLDWTLQRLLAELERWRQLEGAGALCLVLPLAADDLLSEGLPARLEAALARHGLPAEALIVEVDAGTLRRPRLRAAVEALGGGRRVVQLRGFGPAALPLLEGLPLHSAGVDSELVRMAGTGAAARELLGGLQRAAAAMDLRLSAEGVSRREELQVLIETGVAYAAGPYLAAPLDADRVPAWLADAKPLGKLFAG